MTPASRPRVPWPDSASVTFHVARREFLTRARSRIYLVGTLLLVIALPGYVFLQARVFDRTSTTSVGLQGPAEVLAAPLRSTAAALDLHVQARTVTDLQAGRRSVESGDLDALVSGEPTSPTVTVKDGLDPGLSAALTALVRQAALDQALTAGGLDAASVNAAVAAARLHVETLDPTAAERTQRTVVAIFAAALLYVALLLYGQFVAQGVVEEKANRIVEILLPAVRPGQLLFGKVTGIGLIGLVQLLLVGTAGLLAVRATGILSIPQLDVTVVAGGVLWFVLGFVLYALLYAAAASLVTRLEDVAAVTMPITMVLVGTYVAIFFVVQSPGSTAATVLSLLPPAAPVVMPARMASGDAQAWQVVLAVVLTVAVIAGLNAAAARVYANSVLRTGARVRLRDAWTGRP